MTIEHTFAKLIITGPPGAGKTTAIASLSEIPPITTEVLATDELALEKEETTVGLDYGQITLDDGELLAIYGTPGQVRFSFMWEVLATAARGVVLLINHDRADPVQDLKDFAEAFRSHFDQQQVVVGISKYNDAAGAGLADYAAALDALDLQAPLFPVDVREREDVILLIQVLASLTEASGGAHDDAGTSP